jgi:uncharacterized membrane protein YjjP (DUF1212 family)
MALAWVLRRSELASAIVGATRPDQDLVPALDDWWRVRGASAARASGKLMATVPDNLRTPSIAPSAAGTRAETDMTLAARSDLVVAAASVNYANGQSTDHILTAVERLAAALRLRATIVLRWGELHLQAEDGDARVHSLVAVEPSGVHMARVVSVARAIEDLDAGRLDPAGAMQAIDAVAQMPPSPAWLFVLAAAAGALALAVIYGLSILAAAGLIVLSGSAGGILRRQLARRSANFYLQPFAAALLAGMIGALAIRWDVSSPLRLVAVAPCLILVPGPHLLNGVLDLVQGRVHLGAARLFYAAVVLAAIAGGLLLGLALLGESLRVDPPARSVPLLRDIIAAGLAAGCFGVYYNTPPCMLAWPVVVGALAHALRWVAIAELHDSPATGALIACTFVGLVITPVARHRQLPFAAIGFASVVSMMPGSYIVRMAAGLVQIADGSHTALAIISGTMADGATAILIVLAMGAGLIVPKLLIDRFCNSRGRRGKRAALYG